MKRPAKKISKTSSAKVLKQQRAVPSSSARKQPTTGRDAGVLAEAKALGAAIRKDDKPAAAKLLASGFTFIDAAGKTHTRAELLENLQAGSSNTSKVKVKAYGNVALVTGATTSAEHAVFTVDVWIKDKAGWRALIRHNNALAARDVPATHAAPQPRPPGAKPPECRNPLEAVPFRARLQAERDIIATFQRLERAVTRNDAEEWVKHVADEFVVYRTKQHPTTKAGRTALIRRQGAVNAETWVAEIEWMKLWVHGNAAIMRADHVMPGNRRPPYRATRLWLKRNGRWQMAMSQQTTIAESPLIARMRNAASSASLVNREPDVE